MTSYDFSYYLWEFAEDFKDGAKQLKEKTINAGKFLIEEKNKLRNEVIKSIKANLSYQLLKIWQEPGWWIWLKASSEFLELYLYWNWQKQYYNQYSNIWKDFLNSSMYRKLKGDIITNIKDYRNKESKLIEEYNSNMEGYKISLSNIYGNENDTEEDIKKYRKISFDLQLSVWKADWKINVEEISQNKFKLTVKVEDICNYELWRYGDRPWMLWMTKTFLNNRWYDIQDKYVFDIKKWIFKTGIDFKWELNIIDYINF